MIGLFLKLPLMAQTSTISGKVTDTLNQGLPYVDVILKKETDGDIITGTITDEKGHFDFDPKKEGNYRLVASYIGYQSDSLPLNANGANKNLHLQLQESNEALDEVVIESSKPTIQQKIDRFVFNVDQTVSGSVGTANDALKSTPGVKVSNDKLEIVGKGKVRVMVNDKMIRLSGEDLHTYLNNIPADNIERIEVISTPPAKYEAEGDSGLINIVLKEAKQDSWSNTIRTNYKQATYPSFGIGDAFLYHKGKFEISASVDATKGYNQRINVLNLYYDQETWREPINMKNKLDNISGKFNLDYNLSKMATIGVSYNGSSENMMFLMMYTPKFSIITVKKKEVFIHRGPRITRSIPTMLECIMSRSWTLWEENYPCTSIILVTKTIKTAYRPIPRIIPDKKMLKLKTRTTKVLIITVLVLIWSIRQIGPKSPMGASCCLPITPTI